MLTGGTMHPGDHIVVHSPWFGCVFACCCSPPMSTRGFEISSYRRCDVQRGSKALFEGQNLVQPLTSLLLRHRSDTLSIQLFSRRRRRGRFC